MNLSIRSRILLVCFALTMLFVGAGMATANPSPSGSQSYRISDITSEQSAESFQLTVKGNSLPTYTKYELFNPLRIVIDIADASLAESLALPLEYQQGPVSKVTGKLLDDQKPFVSRLEIFLKEDLSYTVDRHEDDIVIKFSQAAPEESGTILQKIDVTNTSGKTLVHLVANGPVENYKEGKLPRTDDRPARLYLDLANTGLTDVPHLIEVGSALAQIRTARRDNGLRIVFDSGLNTLFDYKIDSQDNGLLISIDEATEKNVSPPQKEMRSSAAVSPQPTVATYAVDTDESSSPTSPEQSVAAPGGAQLGFNGYNSQRITVDFFKIDLHNVFRLLGEISGRNMVIEESVSGTLTLALTNVPWDFVLDVVLNLKDLQKEERFNTIVISPKSKAFTWPERASDKLAISTDGMNGAMGGDALSIKQRIETPKGVVEAKKILQQGNEKYAAGDFAGALAEFEKASTKWPENSQLAKRIAALCLVQLGQNAKAVHYAKVALKTTPKDYEAALQAAIGLANMKKNAAAKQYFDLAVSNPKPSREALTSYAAFNEKNGDYLNTLLLLSKDSELYGDSMETILSRARIYDKQGDKAKAAKEYQTLLLSGYEIPADLLRYIKGRLSLSDNK